MLRAPHIIEGRNSVNYSDICGLELNSFPREFATQNYFIDFSHKFDGEEIWVYNVVILSKCNIQYVSS